MFQTDLNHFFQSFSSEPLTEFMRFITALGYVEFFTIFLLILLFCFNLKKGFILFMILLWTALFTFILKDYFDLPRPFHVDSSLEFLDGQLPDDTDFSFHQRDAIGFWEGLPSDVLEVTRRSDGVENGFPSGHTSIAIAFWGGLAMMFRKRWMWTLATAMMILIPLSRIYLGVHFLADVIGGVVLGGAILSMFYFTVLRSDRLSAFLSRDTYTMGFNLESFILLIAPWPFLLLLSPRVVPLIAATIGLGIGYLLLSRKGIPIDDAPIMHRIARLLLGSGLAIGLGFALIKIAALVGLDDNPWTNFIVALLSFAALIWISTEVSIRLGMYKRKRNTFS